MIYVPKRPGTFERPNISIVQDLPDLPEIRRELQKSIDDSWEFYDRNEHALNTRYCTWEGQTRDGRKWGTASKAPFPWAGASDARIRTADMVINEQVEMLVMALARMNIQAIPVQAKDAEWSNRMTSLLRWYLANEMADEADSEIELLANYMLTYGSAVLSVGWLQELAYELQTVRLDDLWQQAQELGGPKMLADIGNMLFNPIHKGQVLQWIGQFSNMLTPRESERILKDLQELGSCEFPRPYVRTARPCLSALQVMQDVFFPANTARLQRARWIAQRELLTEADLRERVEGREQWDEDFVTELIEKYRGDTFNANTQALNLMERQRSLGGAWGEAFDEADDLFEVFHFYSRATHKGIPTLFHTVLHPGCDEYYARHEVLDYAHGEFPMVEFTRERHVPTILASRGWPEVIDTEQDAIKTEYDARRDRSSITTLPPVKVKIRPDQKKNTYGPGVEIPVTKLDDMDVMNWGGPDPTSVEVERNTRRNVAEYVGRSHPEIDPQQTVNRQQALVTRWLRRWTRAATQVLALAQQYTPPMTIGRIVGVIPKPYEISREAIAGNFNLILTFDARYANAEYVMTLLERMEKYVLPMDTNAIIDRGQLLRYTLAMVDPTLADLCVRDEQTADQGEIEDEQNNFAKMFAGMEVPMKLKGQNHGLRLNVLQNILTRNPMFAEIMPVRPDLQKLLDTRIDFLTQQVEQGKNKMIGIYGATPTAGSDGGGSLGDFAQGAQA